MSTAPHMLESHLGQIQGRSRYVPHDAAIALGAFVCPRADGYGAREGVIPPGVAAQHGLIPKGLRKVSTDAALHSARQDDEHPLTAQEQYRAYYGRGAQQQAQRRPAQPRTVNAPAPEVEDVPATQEVQTVPTVPTVPETQRPAAAVPPTVPSTRGSVVSPRPAGHPVASSKRTTKAVKRVKTSPRVFSPENTEANDPETLEGFYADLGRERPHEAAVEPDGPEIAERAETLEPQGAARGDAAPPPSGGVPAVPPLRTPGSVPPGVDARVAELEAALATQQQLAQDWYAEAERRRLDLERHQQLLSRQATELQRRAQEAQAAQFGHEDGPVRVYLGLADVKLKVAGRGWDCNVLGHLCYSRGKTEVALVVTDPGYGSDLLANVQTGECVLVSSAGRTACQYRGHCDKIYGETESPDFITVMRFACDPSKAFA